MLTRTKQDGPIFEDTHTICLHDIMEAEPEMKASPFLASIHKLEGPMHDTRWKKLQVVLPHWETNKLQYQLGRQNEKFKASFSVMVSLRPPVLKGGKGKLAQEKNSIGKLK